MMQALKLLWLAKRHTNGQTDGQTDEQLFTFILLRSHKNFSKINLASHYEK